MTDLTFQCKSRLCLILNDFVLSSFLCIVFVRERPTGNTRGIMEELPNTETEGALLGLPETQTELDVSFFYF